MERELISSEPPSIRMKVLSPPHLPTIIISLHERVFKNAGAVAGALSKKIGISPKHASLLYCLPQKPRHGYYRYLFILPSERSPLRSIDNELLFDLTSMIDSMLAAGNRFGDRNNSYSDLFSLHVEKGLRTKEENSVFEFKGYLHLYLVKWFERLSAHGTYCLQDIREAMMETYYHLTGDRYMLPKHFTAIIEKGRLILEVPFSHRGTDKAFLSSTVRGLYAGENMCSYESSGIRSLTQKLVLQYGLASLYGSAQEEVGILKKHA